MITKTLSYRTDKVKENRVWYNKHQEFNITNAGLIFITPFIKYIFQILDYTRENQFWNEQDKQRAVILLEYIVHGKIPVNNDLLILNKLICDIDISNNFSTNIQLMDLEKENCITLLEAVIQNWEALGNSSIADIRESFLVREGTLLNKESHWGLKIKKLPYDYLTDRIPWEFNKLKFPWMDTEIIIHWE